MRRRALLTLSVAAAGALVGCSTNDPTTSTSSDGDTTTQSETADREDEDTDTPTADGDTITQSETADREDENTDTPTAVGSTWGQITVTAVEQSVTVAGNHTYPTDGNGNSFLDQALSEAAAEGTGGVAIETRSEFEAVESTLEPYPTAPETLEKGGRLLRWESEYYVVTLAKFE